MQADAEARTSLLADGAAAGHDGKFFIASPDGAFRLNVSGQLQFRYNLNFRNDDDTPTSDDFESGFNQPRIRIAFDGTVLDPKLFYKVMADAGTAGGNGDFRLQDTWIGYNFDGGWTLRAGQGITAFMREWYMADQKMLTPERSLQSLIFGQNRSKFIDLKYQNDDVRLIGTFSDGFRSVNSEFNADPADWAVTGRAEWKFAGQWKQLVDEYRSPRGSDYAGALGGAIHFEQGPNRTAGVEEQDLFAWTADILTKGDGWNIMLAGVGYHAQDEAGVSGADFDDYGGLLQGGYHVTDDVEIVARFDAIFPDEDRNGSSTFNTVTGGFNYYLYGQAAKFQLVAIWFLDDTADTRAGNFGNTGGRTPTSALFGSLPTAQDGQVAIMAQWQLLF
ncbi:MAG: hypothetical protein JNK58_05475 [Phycisphaerae bacterium]|nr:hypothetical protein [Phycisphaerae bacterium]